MLNLPRPALVVGFALGALLAVSPSCSGGGNGGTGGGSGGGNGGSGGSGGSGNDAQAFCNDLSNAYCDYGIKCGFASMNGKNDCVTYFKAAFCGASVQEAVKGFQTYDNTKGQACIAAVKATDCNSQSSVLFDSCNQMFSPNSGTNGGCLSPSDCKNVATESCGGASCSKTCQAAGMQGQPCPQRTGCANGLRCDSTTNTCVPPGAIGATCAAFVSNQCDATGYCDTATLKCVALPTSGQTCRTSFPQCTNGFYCSSNLCQAKLALNASCFTTSSCQDALFCNTALTPDSCQTRLAANASCVTGSDSCQAGLKCIGGTCTAPKGAGGSCTNFGDCSPELECDSVLRVCTAYTYDLTAGQTCTGYARDCASGLRCIGAVVNPSGGVGTVGMCAVPKVGDSCTYRGSSECPAESFCNLAVDGGPGTCVAASSGSPCSSSSQCKASDYCEATLCATRKTSGAACTTSDSCVAPLSCVDGAGGTKTCGTLGDLNAPCVVPTSSSNSNCLFPFTCIGGTCKHSGNTGEPCLSGGLCLGGFCPQDGGSCQGPQANGADCRLSSDCASGRCYNSKCEASCP